MALGMGQLDRGQTHQIRSKVLDWLILERPLPARLICPRLMPPLGDESLPNTLSALNFVGPRNFVHRHDGKKSQCVGAADMAVCRY
jgi:hypothetical protein